MPPFGASSSNIKINQPDQFGQGNPVSNSRDPTEGPKVFSFQFNFATTPSNPIDLTMELQAGRISGIQTCYIDNSSNNMPVIVDIGGTGQRISVAPGHQQYMPVLASNPCTLTFTSNNSIATAVYAALLNVPMPFATWGPNEPAPTGSAVFNSGTINAQGNTGMFLAGGTYAVVANAGTWGGASALLEILAGDGVTYVPVSTAFTANIEGTLLLAPGIYRLAVTVADPTGLVVTLTQIPT